MSRRIFLLRWILICLLGVAPIGLSERWHQSAVVGEHATSNAVPVRPRSVFLRRVANLGSRHGGDERFLLAVLAPDGLGLCTTNQPRFWWFISESSTNTVEFTLNKGLETVLKAELDGPAARGLHQLDLAQLTGGKPNRLEPNTYYEWTLRLREGNDPAVHPVSIGWIQWIPPKLEFSSQITKAPLGQHPAAYAAEGYWYDALAQLATAVISDAPDTEAVAQLRRLLDQAGLQDVALPETPTKPVAQ